MVGFVAGLPFLYQMVPRERQLEVPKYVRPRTDTPALTIGHGGCFGCIYSVRGAGGYQMFGITPLPIYAPERGEVFFRTGDIVSFKSISRDDYDALREAPHEPRSAPVSFELEDFEADPDGYNARLLEVLG
jgi:urea carboxylase